MSVFWNKKNEDKNGGYGDTGTWSAAELIEDKITWSESKTIQHTRDDVEWWWRWFEDARKVHFSEIRNRI